MAANGWKADNRWLSSSSMKDRSPYRNGWLALGAVFLILLPAWLVVGISGAGRHSAYYFGSAIFWVALVLLLANWPRCPNCRRSVFTGQWGVLQIGRPWPSRYCSRCRADLKER